MNYRLVTGIKECIKENYMDVNFCVKVLAQNLGISGSYLSDVVHNYWGMGPRKLIESVRLEEAVKLIDHERTLYELSRKVGYADVRIFRRAFTKRLGMTPSECRDMISTLKGDYHGRNPCNQVQGLLNILWLNRLSNQFVK